VGPQGEASAGSNGRGQVGSRVVHSTATPRRLKKTVVRGKPEQTRRHRTGSGALLQRLGSPRACIETTRQGIAHGRERRQGRGVKGT
jgi:hypothetical protein